MIPCFVISLPDCVERRETISRALDSINIRFEFFDAIDGRNGLDPVYEHEIDRSAARRNGHLLSDGEYACALSHKYVYREIVDHKIPYALVLEDDALPYHQLRDFISRHHYRDAELTQIYCTHQGLYVRRRGAKRIFGKHTSYLRAGRLKCPGAVAYTISNQAARHFVQYATPVKHAADWPECVETLVKQESCRVIYPPLVGHSHERSNSLIDGGGRRAIMEKRKFFGVYLPPLRKMARSCARVPHKLISARLN